MTGFIDEIDKVPMVGSFVGEWIAGKASPIKRGAGHCDKHGDFVGFARADAQRIDCPKCIVERADDSMRKGWARERCHHLFHHAGLPRRYRDAGFREYQIHHDGQKVVLAAMTAFFAERSRVLVDGSGMIVTGAKGTGKTRLVCCLANNFMRHLISVRYWTMADMLADIKTAYTATNGDTEASKIRRLVHGHDLLILDEIDVNRGTDNDKQLIFQVINGRYNEQKPTIVVTNQMPEGLDDFIGERSADRIRENAVVVVCNWPSYRKVAQ